MSYGFYVWVCYALAAMVLGAICFVSFYDMAKQRKLLSEHKDQAR